MDKFSDECTGLLRLQPVEMCLAHCEYLLVRHVIFRLPWYSIYGWTCHIAQPNKGA